ncbi:MAG: hypothetical protein D4R64_06200 [Porphyromonadaceae bacterium]|nr:MAG: hypothetical protein D4R64_06200 [Porphyromonadaceae bacterium]
MTVISALFSKKGIAVATDSMLTALDHSGGNVYLEWQQAKIISVPKLNACISYWGFAGTLKKVPKPDQKAEWLWLTYDWLKKQSENPKYKTLEDFSKDIREGLDKEFNKLSFNKPTDKGIGLHIAGLEKIDGYIIPELFLVCNFTDPSYQKVESLGISRNTFHTIANVPATLDHNKKEFRIKVKEFLSKGGLISYNNGDPVMFNMVSSTISYGFQIATQRKVLKQINSVQDTIPIVKRPIEIISTIQKDFYKPDKRMVGGKIHDLCIDNYGNINSTSGDK